MSFPRYPDYKDSGVPWLGEVPSHWVVSSLRHSLADIFNGLTADQIDPGDATVPVTRIETISNGTINFEKVGFVSQNDARSDRKLEFGDICFSNINSLKMIGNCAIYLGGQDIYGGMNLLVLRPAGAMHPQYLYWVIRSDGFRETVESYAKPAINQASISQSSLLSIGICTPSKEEQTAIATFLDRETAKIDALVAEQEKLIALLQEKRQAVISHAVTKGLDPNVPMKDSGVEWLGEVPVHWEVLRIKQFTAFAGGGTPSRDVTEYWHGEIPWVSPKDMKTEFIVDSEERITDDGLRSSPTSLIPIGAVLMVVRSGILKHTIPVAINQQPVSLNQDMKALRFDSSRIAPLYFLRFVQGLNDTLLLEWSKQGATVESIEHEYLANSFLPVPPLLEQTTIANFLDQEIAKLNTLMTEARTAITLLQARRTALISAAVTGQIDVRGLAGSSANTPDFIAASACAVSA